MHIANSLCCVTLENNYTPIKKKKKELLNTTSKHKPNWYIYYNKINDFCSMKYTTNKIAVHHNTHIIHRVHIEWEK